MLQCLQHQRGGRPVVVQGVAVAERPGGESLETDPARWQPIEHHPGTVQELGSVGWRRGQATKQTGVGNVAEPAAPPRWSVVGRLEHSAPGIVDRASVTGDVDDGAVEHLDGIAPSVADAGVTQQPSHRVELNRDTGAAGGPSTEQPVDCGALAVGGVLQCHGRDRRPAVLESMTHAVSQPGQVLTTQQVDQPLPVDLSRRFPGRSTGQASARTRSRPFHSHRDTPTASTSGRVASCAIASADTVG